MSLSPGWDLLGHLEAPRTSKHVVPGLKSRPTTGCPVAGKCPTCTHLFPPLKDADGHCPRNSVGNAGSVPALGGLGLLCPQVYKLVTLNESALLKTPLVTITFHLP